MTSFSFFWHDYETFGRDPRRDWPAQFAGLRTDAELNPVGEPVMMYCRPPTDRLPDPESCLLTGITPQRCAAEGLPEHEFAARVQAALGAAGTVGVGYNTIRFDDEFTRFLFWRNLIDPYAREWRDGCGRWDLLDAMRCAWALRPDGIEWPRHDDGRVSFRLEHLSAANGLAHADAHDALSDVRATVALARLLRQRQRRLFDFCLRLRHKAAVAQEIGADRPFLHVSGRYPVERGCLALVWPLGAHPSNRNELIVWDLAHDPAELLELDADAVRSRLFVRDADLAEGTTRLPIKTIHVNRSPVVIGNPATLTDAMAERWGIDREVWARHAQVARRIGAELAARRDTLWPAVYARPQPDAPTDVDADLYGGFIGDEDRRALDRLRASPGRPRSFHDPRLDELVFRWRARNFPEALKRDERQRWEAHRRRRLIDGDAGAATLVQFRDRIAAARATADARGAAILDALGDWADAIAPELQVRG